MNILDQYETTIDAFDGDGDVPVTVDYLLDDGVRIEAVRLASGFNVMPQMEQWELDSLTNAITRQLRKSA